MPPAILITLVLVFGRMSGPALMLYQSGQQLVFALPSFESVRALEADLSLGAPPEQVAPVPPPPGPIELVDASFEHPSGRGVQDVRPVDRAGQLRRHRRPLGRGQDHPGRPDRRAARAAIGRGAHRRRRARSGAARRLGERDRLCLAGRLPVPRYRPLQPRLGQWRRERRRDRRRAGACWRHRAGRADEQGLDTVVGERGTLLSGGERQRISLARALLRKPRLLVLDEAANAIDAPSEAALLDRLVALDPRPTILMISHREESLGWCERVIRVESGRVSG
ncbi:MAG: ATP-binding cassette domain-containing protein [Hyphomicrobium sp.]